MGPSGAPQLQGTVLGLLEREGIGAFEDLMEGQMSTPVTGHLGDSLFWGPYSLSLVLGRKLFRAHLRDRTSGGSLGTLHLAFACSKQVPERVPETARL